MSSCPLPNIGPRGRRRRIRVGGAALAVSVLLAIPLAAAPRPLRVLLVVPLFSAFLGLFQARERT